MVIHGDPHRSRQMSTTSTSNTKYRTCHLSTKGQTRHDKSLLANKSLDKTLNPWLLLKALCENVGQSSPWISVIHVWVWEQVKMGSRSFTERTFTQDGNENWGPCSEHVLPAPFSLFLCLTHSTGEMFPDLKKFLLLCNKSAWHENNKGCTECAPKHKHTQICLHRVLVKTHWVIELPQTKHL